MFAPRAQRAATVLLPLAFGLAAFSQRRCCPGSGARTRAATAVTSQSQGRSDSAMTAGWVVGTSTAFALLRPPSELPLGLRHVADYLARGAPDPRRVAAIAERDGPAGARSREGDIGGGLVNSAVLLFCLLPWAPFLLGWLVRGGVVRPVEAAAVVAMGVVSIGWTVILILRARPGHPPDDPTAGR